MISGGLARPARRLSILLDVQDLATARLAAANGIAQKAGNSFQGTAQSANRMKMALAGAVVAAGAATIAMNRMVQAGAQLDRTFAVIEETSGATAEQMSHIVEQTQEIAAQMPVTMDEVAGAFEQMTYAGFEAAEAIDAAHSVTQLAVAGQMDMAEAADIMTSMLNAFNLEAEQSHQITSTLAATFSNSAIEIGELGSALQYSATQMNQLGFDATEAAAATGVLADQGMRGTMAGTSMNQAFTQLMSTADKTEDALAAAGLAQEDFLDEDGEMKSMVEIMGILNQAMDDVNATQAEMSAWAQDIFGVRGARAVLPLMNNYDELEDKIQDAALATLKDFMAEVDEADQTRMSIIMDLDDPDEISEMREELREMDEEEVQALADERGVDPAAFQEPMDVIEELRRQAEEGEMGEAEMQESLAAMFDMEDEPAHELTQMIHDTEMSLDDLEEALDAATSGGELTAAQMDNVAGRMEYLRGSMMSILYTIYTGFRPAIELILDILIAWADLISSNTLLLKAFGAAMFTVTAAIFSYAGYVAWAAFASSGFGTAIITATGALWAHVSALGTATAFAIKNALAQGTLTAAKQGFFYSITQSNLALLIEAKQMVAQMGIKAALTKVTWGLAASIKGVMAALYATNPVGWALLAVMLAISAVLVAVRRDMFGLGSAAGGLRERLGALWSSVKGWFSDWILGPAIEAVVRPLRWLIGGIQDAVNWFRELSLVGQLIIALFLIPISGPLAAAAAGFAILQSLIRVTTDVLGALGVELGPVTSLIGEIAIGLGQMVEVLGMFVAGLIELAATKVGAIFKEITDALNMILNPLHWVVATFQLLGDVASKVAEIFDTDFSDDVDRAATASLSLARAFERLYDVFAAIWGIIETLVDLVVDVADWFKNTDAIQWVRDKLADIVGYLERLEELEDTYFGWIPDGEDAQEAGEATRNLLPDGDEWRDRTQRWAEGLLPSRGGSDEEVAQAQTGAWHSEQDADEGVQQADSGMVANLRRAADALQRIASQPDALRGAGAVPTPSEAQPSTGSGEPAVARTGSHIQSQRESRREYKDDRSVTVNQNPTINIDGGTGGVSPDMVQRAVEAGMQEAEMRSLESFIDWLTLGGPDAFDGQMREEDAASSVIDASPFIDEGDGGDGEGDEGAEPAPDGEGDGDGDGDTDGDD